MQPICTHELRWTEDSVGDPTIPHGLDHFEGWECQICGEWVDLPAPGPDDRDYSDMPDDPRADYPELYGLWP